MTEQQAMRMALEALEKDELHMIPDKEGHMVFVKEKAITALRQALEQADEPVAMNWSVFNTGAEVWDKLSLADAVVELTPTRLERGWSAVCVINKDNPPLYTRPQPAEEPVAIKWEKDADKECGYNNWVGITPFGQILITWKGWKEYHDACVDEFPGDFQFYGSPDEVKAACEAEYLRRINTRPQPAAWVGLTLEDKKEYLAQDFGGSRTDAMDWAEAKLREKNTGETK